MDKRRFRDITSCLRVADTERRAVGGAADPAAGLREFERMCHRMARTVLFVPGTHMSGDDDSNPTQSGTPLTRVARAVAPSLTSAWSVPTRFLMLSRGPTPSRKRAR